ncbi:MAG: L-threonylcarbamoyladenylate synthase [archaeon]
MRVFSQKDFEDNRDELISRITGGAVFIYPTDTIYGIGCSALNSASVKRVRLLKERDEKPFSVMAPSVRWIEDNCETINNGWLDRLPGPYTLILRLKKKAVCREANNGMGTIGVRIPDHWFSRVAADTGLPIITTSVNISGKKPRASLEELKQFDVDFIVYEGKKPGSPSTLVDLTKKAVFVRKR